MGKRKQRAATSHVTRSVRIRSWTTHHAGCLNNSLRRLFHKPLSSLLTMAVLAIALALPGGLYVLSQNLLSLSEHWDTDTQMTLYLNQNVDDQQAELFAEQLSRDPRFSRVDFLSRTDALEEFRQMTEFQQALQYITDNPLPAVIILTPTSNIAPDALADLQNELTDRSQVELAQLDLDWIKRMRGIINIVQHAVIIIAVILAVAVILVVGNTIRLEIENRREEIVITKLFGATHAYIRRPFLYDGMWYGLFGGLLASLLIVAALWLLSEPVMRLITLYESSFALIFPNALFVLGITMLGGLLGYLGAWTAVSQHLYKIEPE